VDKTSPYYDDTIGGWSDHYVISGTRVCHPDFDTQPIGNPYGPKVCVRRKSACGTRIDHVCEKCNRSPLPIDNRSGNGNNVCVACSKTMVNGVNVNPGGQCRTCGGKSGECKCYKGPKNVDDAYLNNGYHRYSINLYDPYAEYPTAITNPAFYSSRRIPSEQDLYRADYIKSDVRYNANGINLVRTPDQDHGMYGYNKGDAYYEYAYSFTPKENDNSQWDTRKPNLIQRDSIPGPKYDVTRLEQPYDIWRREQLVVAKNKDQLTQGVSYEERKNDIRGFDRKYNSNIVF